MKNFYVLLLVMLSLAEIIFTVVYIYLSQTVNLVIMVGAVAYTGAVYSLYNNYTRETYEEQKKQLMECP